MPTLTIPTLRTSRHDSPLGRWTITTLAPHALLRGIVRHIWHGAGRVAYARDRILPGARSYLLINLGLPQYLVAAGPPQPRTVFDDVWFCGINERPLDAEAPHGSVIVGVELTATGAAVLLPWRQSELANYIGPMTDLLGADAARLRERLANTASAAERLTVTQSWLLDRCVSGRQIHPLVHWATRRIADSGGGLRAAALAREAGCSRKHLLELFQRQVGLGPKALARIHRFQSALGRIRDEPGRAWSELTSECGYYDQSHLINEFQAFAGMSPATFARQAMPDANSVVVK